MDIGSLTETIVAPITALGGAVAVIRVSGPDSAGVGRQVFRGFPHSAEPRRCYYGEFLNGDDGLGVMFEEGASFTGEQSIEFSVHGSAASVDSLVRACLDAGCRMAEPGEFTLRAFMNGRIDLSQAEGVRAAVEASTAQQVKMAGRLRAGDLRGEVGAIREACLAVLASVEAHTDFSEELGDFDCDGGLQSVQAAKVLVDRLLSTQPIARLRWNGASLAIIGLPNAGKSSLLNILLGEERAIVTPIAGTTRDTVEETVVIGTIPVRIVDTAGLRETPDTVESIGVERAKAAAKSADLVLYVYDVSAGWSAEDELLLADLQGEVVLVANKLDLGDAGGHGIRVSCLTREGLVRLTSQIEERLGGDRLEADGYLVDRHYELLGRVREILVEVETTFGGSELPVDLASVHLRQAIRLLGEITGETASADLVSEIFSRFCLGK